MQTTYKHNISNILSDYQLMEISFYDVRYIQRFNWFIYQLPELACKNNGYLVAGTPKIIQKLGMSRPNYCSITQWKTIQDFKCYREQGKKDLIDIVQNFSHIAI